MSVERDNGIVVVKVGSPTLCATCRHGCIVTVRQVPHPDDIAKWLHEHPEAHDDVESIPFRAVDQTDSYCRNPKLIGADGPFRAGRVLTCEAFEVRWS